MSGGRSDRAERDDRPTFSFNVRSHCDRGHTDDRWCDDGEGDRPGGDLGAEGDLRAGPAGGVATVEGLGGPGAGRGRRDGRRQASLRAGPIVGPGADPRALAGFWAASSSDNGLANAVTIPRRSGSPWPAPPRRPASPTSPPRSGGCFTRTWASRTWPSGSPRTFSPSAQAPRSSACRLPNWRTLARPSTSRFVKATSDPRPENSDAASCPSRLSQQ